MEKNKKNFEAKKFLKPIIMGASLFLGNPDPLIATEIHDSCQKIKNITKFQKELDENVNPAFSNIDLLKNQKIQMALEVYCKNPEGIGYDKKIEKISNYVESAENFLDEVIGYEKDLKYDILQGKKFSQVEKNKMDKEFFSEFFQIQGKFLQDSHNFLKNFTDYDVFTGNLKYEVKSGDSIFNILKNILNTEKADKIHKKINELKKLDKSKLIKRIYSRDNKKSITSLTIGDQIDFGYAIKNGVFKFSEKIEKYAEKYPMGFLLEMYVKGNNFPLNLDRNMIFNPRFGKFNAFCAGSMHQLDQDNYKSEFAIAYNEEIGGQDNAYKVIRQILKKGGEVLDTGPDPIYLIAISDYNLNNYGPTNYKKVKIKVAKNKRYSSRFSSWKLDDNNKPYLEFFKKIPEKRINKKWNDPAKPSDRIYQMEDGRWVGLEMEPDNILKERSVNVYEQALKNPGSLIFWHYTQTGELPKIILEHYNFYLKKQNGELTSEEKKEGYRVASYGSHYVKNLGYKKLNYNLYQLQNLSQKGENLPLKNIDINQKISVSDAISAVISGWNNSVSDNFVDKEKIFKEVKITIKTLKGTLTGTLYDFWKGDYKKYLKFNITKDDIFSVEDVVIVDEYLAQGRIKTLTGMLTAYEDNSEKVKNPHLTFASFVPTLVVTIPDKYKEPVIPDFVKIIEKTDGVEFAGIDSPQNFIICDISLSEIGGLSLPFSNEMIDKIYDFYNEKFGKLDGYKFATWNRGAGSLNSTSSVYFQYKWTKNGGKLIFSETENNFDEIFDRWVKEGKYKKNDKVRVKYFLKRMGFYQVNYNKISGTVKFPILKFSKSNKENFVYSDKFELISVDEINKIGEESGIEFFKNINELDLKNIKKVTDNDFYQAVLLSFKGFETGSGGVKTKIEELLVNFDNYYGTSLISSIGDFQINYNDFVEISKNFFTKDFSKIDKKFQTEFNEKIFNEFNKKYGKYFKSSLGLKNFGKSADQKEKFEKYKIDIKKFILDEKNIGTKYLAGLIFLSEKEKNIHTYASRYYGDEFYSIISQDTPIIGYKDNLLMGSFDVYKGELNENIIRGQSYILNKILYGGENFNNSEIQGKIDINFHKKIIEVINKNKDIIEKLGICIDDRSIEKSLKGYRNGKYIYTDNLNRIFGGSLFKADMGHSDAENVFLVLKKIYKEKFGVYPPMFMDNSFRENYLYFRKGKNISLFDDPLRYGKAKFKGTDKGNWERLRGGNVLKMVYKILKEVK